MSTLKELAEKLRNARDPLGPFGPFAYYRIAEIEAVADELEKRDIPTKTYSQGYGGKGVVV